MTTTKPTLATQELTREEWNNSLRMPTPVRNKKKYRRTSKHSKNY